MSNEFESPEAFYKRVTSISSCWAAIDAIASRDLMVSRDSAEAKIVDSWLRQVWLAGYEAAQNDCNPFRDYGEPFTECPYPERPTTDTEGK